MTTDEAIQKIVESTSDIVNCQFLAEKFVYDTLDYCHRQDFPPSLIYTAIQFVKSANELYNMKDNAPLKALQESDTRFEFAVTGVNLNDDIESVFNRLKPKLNLYRRLSWNSQNT